MRYPITVTAIIFFIVVWVVVVFRMVCKERLRRKLHQLQIERKILDDLEEADKLLRASIVSEFHLYRMHTLHGPWWDKGRTPEWHQEQEAISLTKLEDMEYDEAIEHFFGGMWDIDNEVPE